MLLRFIMMALVAGRSSELPVDLPNLDRYLYKEKPLYNAVVARLTLRESD